MVRNMIRVQRGNGTTRPNSLASVSYADLMVLNEQRFQKKLQLPSPFAGLTRPSERS